MTLTGRINRFIKSENLLFCLFLIVFFAGFLYSQNQKQSIPEQSPKEDFKIAVKSRLVVLPVSVTDKNGNFLAGLGKEDFQVFEDGRPQKVSVFTQEDSPVTVGLIVDHSRSMKIKMPVVAAAINAFANSSNPQDEMFVIDFNDSISMSSFGGKPFTNNSKQLAEAVLSVSASGRTALYDAIARGIERLKLGRSDKKALIIVSDGEDNASKLNYKQIEDMAKKSQVMIYSIALIDPFDEENSDALLKLSRNTGGLAFQPKSVANVTDISTSIAHDIRSLYTVGFIPGSSDTDLSYHKLKVTVSDHGKTKVRTREGYYGGITVQPAQQATKIGP